MARTAIDTQERSGDCGGILQSGLGAAVDWRGTEASGCLRFSAGQVGPNQIHIYWAALKPEPGAGGASPAGPYRFAEFGLRDRPSEGVLRSAIERYHPDVLREGLPIGEALWFVADRGGRVMHAGRGPVYGSSRTASLELEKMHTGIDIGPIWMSSQVRPGTGERIGLVWATVKEPARPRMLRIRLAPSTPRARCRSSRSHPLRLARQFVSGCPGRRPRIPVLFASTDASPGPGMIWSPRRRFCSSWCRPRPLRPSSPQSRGRLS
ncbi:hypothetical protein BH23GEM8_BH23GEM8_10840 [soil metagenome]